MTPSMLSLWSMLLRFGVLVWIVTGAAVFIARLAAAPLSQASLLARNTCALPCVFGITPGLTTRDQAMRTFDRAVVSFALLQESQPESILRQTDTARSMMMQISFGSQIGTHVQSVQLYDMSSAYNLGVISDFLLAGYHPTRVYSGCTNAQRILLQWDDTYLQVTLGARLEPSSRVMLLAVSTDPTEAAEAIAGFHCAVETDWRGFAPQWKYQAGS